MRLSWQAWRSLQSWSSTCQPESLNRKLRAMEVAAVESRGLTSWRSQHVFVTLFATPMCLILGHLGESVVRCVTMVPWPCQSAQLQCNFLSTPVKPTGSIIPCSLVMHGCTDGYKIVMGNNSAVHENI